MGNVWNEKERSETVPICHPYIHHSLFTSLMAKYFDEARKILQLTIPAGRRISL